MGKIPGKSVNDKWVTGKGARTSINLWFNYISLEYFSDWTITSLAKRHRKHAGNSS
jgi:hypothetical protein